MFATIFLSTKGGWRHAETVHHITNRLEAEKGRCPGPRGSGLFLFDMNIAFRGKFAVFLYFPATDTERETHRFL